MMGKRKHFILAFIVISINYSFSQEFKSRILDSTTAIKAFNINKLLNDSLNLNEIYKEADFNSKILFDSEELLIKKNNEIYNRNASSTNAAPPYGDNGPSNMVDKYTLKPIQGDLANGLPNFSEDLHNGKVNVSIPLLEFEYYDYKIPITISNRYPQVIEDTHGEPTFYAQSNVGGDWSFSLDQFKVTRQVNGIEDENSSKGYFTTISQSKVLYPQNISNDDVHTGLKGEWDTAPDIFNFVTPTISGSFVINPFNGQYDILSSEKFHVDFELVDNKLYKFIITDNSGIKYVFGGNSKTIEISQSITDVFSFGRYKDGDYNKQTVSHIIEVINNNVETIAELPNNANLFVQNQVSSPYQLPSPNQILGSIQQNNNSISTVIQFLAPLGNVYDSTTGTNRSYYAITNFNSSNNVTQLLNGETYNDPDMRRYKVNTGWYLKDIILTNGKKINFIYDDNDLWTAYRTFGSNKIKIDLFTSGNDFTYQYQSNYGNFIAELNGLDVYGCFPDELDFMQFPINETHTQTTHFVKKPGLFRIQDEDGFSILNLHSKFNNPQGYVGLASQYPNAPSETIFNGSASNGLLWKLQLIKHNGGETSEVEFFNHTLFSYYIEDDGSTSLLPWKDRSYLDEIIINGRKKFTFDYEGSRLKRIHYPTGGTKEFFSTNINSYKTYFNISFEGPGYLYGLHEAVADKIITTSENNITEEEFFYDSLIRANGAYSTKKTFRPDVASCTSGASLFSTAPIYSGHTTKSGTSYLEVEKHINGELQFTSEYTSNIETPNSLRLTNDTSPEYLNNIGRPSSFLDEQQGYLKKNALYKTDEDGNSQIVKESIFTRDFDYLNAYPCIYLSKIEAGPWQDITGAIKRGYSTYYYPVENNLMLEQNIEKDYFDNGNFSFTENLTYFKRTRIPPIGLNINRPYWTKYYDNEENLFETKMYSPIEVLNLTSWNLPITISNSIFNNLLSNNRVPNLETVSFYNGKLVNSTANKYGFTPYNNNGQNFAVLKKEKMLELSSTNLNSTDYEVEILDTSNPQNIIFDDKLKDKVEYDKYDEDGRVLEFHSLESGVYTSIIWGYKKQLPVAVVVNARYNDLLGFIQDIEFHSSQSGLVSLLVSDLNNLRNALPNAQVTTYTYKGTKPSIITNPRGENVYYEYNGFNELETVKDKNGHIIEKYSYNYKTLSNFTRNFALSEINWLNPRNYLNVGHNIFCEIIPSGGSGNYTFSYTFKREGITIASGNEQFASLDLIDGNYTGFIVLEFEVTDNYTGITLSESRQFYVHHYPEGTFNIHYNNIQQNLAMIGGYFSSATVTSPQADTLRFWAFNMSTTGEVTIVVKGVSHVIGNYQTKIIEVPVIAGETVNCSIVGIGPINYVMLEIQNPLYGTANPTNPYVLTLSN